MQGVPAHKGKVWRAGRARASAQGERERESQHRSHNRRRRREGAARTCAAGVRAGAGAARRWRWTHLERMAVMLSAFVNELSCSSSTPAAPGTTTAGSSSTSGSSSVVSASRRSSVKSLTASAAGSATAPSAADPSAASSMRRPPMRLAKAGVAAAGIAVAQPAAGRLAPMVGGTTHPRAAAIREASRTRCSCIFKLRARGEVQGRAASEREGVQVECWLFLTTASLPGGKSLRRKSLAPAQRVAQQLRPPPRARKAAAPLGGTRARRVGRQAQRRGDSPGGQALCASVQGRSLRE
jgi:hypothetical protein